jgi:hypothetical protein
MIPNRLKAAAGAKLSNDYLIRSGQKRTVLRELRRAFEDAIEAERIYAYLVRTGRAV